MGKIVLIGAGSASFGSRTIADFVLTPELAGSQLWLVDVVPDTLATMEAFAKKLSADAQVPYTITATTDRRAALQGADFVITSIAVRREELWELDFKVPLKYGVKHVLGENGGPGGLFHTLRSVPRLIEIARDIEAICPKALLINFSNPESRVCLGVTRYTNVRTIGLCHGIWGERRCLAHVLGLPHEELDVLAAGINHFTWILELSHKGRDLYPELRERLETYDPNFQPLSRFMFGALGYYPSPGDNHIGEYLPYAWEFIGIGGYDFAAARSYRDQLAARIRDVACGKRPSAEFLASRSGEVAVDIIRDLVTGKKGTYLAGNLPNKGYIRNLSQDAVVEVPFVVDGEIRGQVIGDLPEGIAALCEREIRVQKLAVDAAVKGSRELALQALLADPVVPSAYAAERILEELLCLQAEWLPSFG